MCDCIEKSYKGELPEKYHTQLSTTLPIKKGIVARVILKTELTWNAPKRTKPISVIAAFCPICGEAYKDAEATNV